MGGSLLLLGCRVRKDIDGNNRGWRDASLEFTVRQTPDTKRINTTTHKLRFRGLVYDINGVLPNYKSLDYMKITAGTRKAGEQDAFD